MLQFLLIALFAVLPINASALSCIFSHELMIKCENTQCRQGFIIPRKSTGAYCERILDLNGNEEIETLDPNLEILQDKDLKDGFYILECQSYMPSYPKDYFKLTKSKFLTVDCSNFVDSPISIIPQAFQSTLSIEEVRRELVIQSRIEITINLLINLLLPSLIAGCLIGGRSFGSKHEGKFVIALFLLSCTALTQLLWGRGAWIISGLLGIFVVIAWLIKKLINKRG